MQPNTLAKVLPVVVILAVVAFAASRCVKVIPAGHVGVATLFGSVQDKPYDAGFHIVNPLLGWTEFDARQKTHKETAGVPSQDQLTTDIDVSVQYRILGSMAPEIFKDTGTPEQAIEIHLIPKVRSLLREQGKTIKNAQDFFTEETQQRLQVNLQAGLEEFLTPKGIGVEDVLIRDIRLPAQLVQRIESKKAEEQELARTEFEQQRKVVQAKAERQAAEEEAARRKLIADAQAYEINAINEAIAQNPAYIQLQSLEALKSMSKDPAAKIYFLNGDSPAPLPLLNLGEAPAAGR